MATTARTKLVRANELVLALKSCGIAVVVGLRTYQLNWMQTAKIQTIPGEVLRLGRQGIWIDFRIEADQTDIMSHLRRFPKHFPRSFAKKSVKAGECSGSDHLCFI